MIKAQTSQLSITMFQNMSETYQLPDFLEPTLTTQVSHFIFTPYFQAI